MSARLAIVLAVLAIAAGLIVGMAVAAATSDAQAGCIRVNAPAGVYVDLNNDLEPQTIAHADAAVRAGAPRILHLDRTHADEHRRAALNRVAPRPGLDRDEYPPAFTFEGGAASDVRYIDPTDNRRAGARMGAALRAFCDGQAFILEP